MFTTNDVFVNLRTAVHIVGLDRQHFLQDVGGAVSFEGPHFHFAETLTAELRLAAERLLRDERVRTGRTGVHLLDDEVMQLQVVHVADRHRTFERFTRTAVVEAGLRLRRRELEALGFGVREGEVEHHADLLFRRTVKDRRRKGHAALEVVGEDEDFFVRQAVEVFVLARAVVNLIEEVTDLTDLFGTKHLFDTPADALGGPAEVNFEHLTDVHTRRHAQRVQDDVGGTTVGHVRHVFDRADLRDHALVAVAAGHLVAGLQTTTFGNVHLDHLQDARREFVTARELVFLDLVLAFVVFARGFNRLARKFDLVLSAFLFHAEVEELVARRPGEHVLREFHAGFVAFRTAGNLLADEETAQTIEGVAFDDAELVVQVAAIVLEFILDDAFGTLVALHAVAGEDLNVDDGARHAGRHAQRGVLHVRSLFAEDHAQKLFFRRELGFALGRDLADEHVARLHFGADVHDAGLVEAHELAFGEVRNVAGDFFGAELRVAGDHGELFDVDRRVAVVGDDAFGDQHRVFVVVAVPRHEGDQHVLTEGEFAHVGRSAVGNDVAAFNAVALDDDRTLIDVRRLVRTGELLQVVDVHARFAHHAFVVVDADHDAVVGYNKIEKRLINSTNLHF